MLRYYFNRILKKIFGKRLVFVYPTVVGLKNFNLGFLSILKYPYVIEELILEPDRLYLGPDFLKDAYTLLDVKITDSPHYRYMESLNCNGDIRETDYIKRRKNGTLDWRDCKPINSSFIEKAKQKFIIHKREIEDNKYNPILVYEIRNRYYIFDGKHRASLCALLNKTIKCRVISCNCVTSFYGDYLYEIIKGDPLYSKHDSFYSQEDCYYDESI